MSVIDEIRAERARQIDVEGWTPEHDDAHDAGELALAAACYALPPGVDEIPGPPPWWPWDRAWWKPSDRRRELIKAAALLVAEIERIDRSRKGEQGIPPLKGGEK